MINNPTELSACVIWLDGSVSAVDRVHNNSWSNRGLAQYTRIWP